MAQKPIPYDFVLEQLASLSPVTNPMFGAIAIYVGEKIVLILRERPSSPQDNGIWLATTEEHHASLREELPSLKSIEMFGRDVTGWQVLPASSDDFEESALRVCELVRARDPRIGKVPKAKRSKVALKKASKKAPKKAPKKRTVRRG